MAHFRGISDNHTYDAIDWERYLTPPEYSVATHRAKSASSFARQRDNISKLCHILCPRTVVCMGAGYLNDIPEDDLIAIGADVYFVEWVKGITEQAFRYDLIKQIEEQFACLVCKCSGDPQKYCKNYQKQGGFFSRAREKESGDICKNFSAAGQNIVPLCSNYAPGEFPQFVHADVTQGIAEHFAREIPGILKRAQNPRQAFRRAVQTSERPCANKLLPLGDHSVDFITSSMVASQFDFEPYTYFIRNLLLRFGQNLAGRHIDELETLEKTLRDNLFLSQVEGHCREMLRLLKPQGRIYFSIETLHKDKPSDPWFHAEVASKTMGIIGQHFYFDMESLPEIAIPERAAMVKGGTSVIHAYLLLPKGSAQ
jgi:hypothetical protein